MFGGGGDTLNITDIYSNTFSATSKSTGSEITLNSPAQSQLTLSIDTWTHLAYLIEDKELQQILRGSDLLSAYAEQAVYKVGKAVDTSLLALYSGLSQTVNDTASDVEDADVRNAIENVMDDDVPFDDCAFFFHPTVVWHDLMGTSKYTGVYDSDPVASGGLGGMSPRRRKAYRGRLYGVPVYETTNIQADGASSAYYNLFAHPKAFMYGTQTPGGGRIRSQSQYLIENLGTVWVTDVIYGVKELRDAAACVIKSRQSGIVS